MMSPRSVRRTLPLTLCALAFAACTGKDKAADTAPAGDSTDMAAAQTQWQARKKAVDSVLKVAPTTAQVAKQKGPMYDVADAELAAAVRKEAQKTYDCYTKTLRDYDPTLAGVVQVLVNFGAAGWDLVRVEQWNWSSPAGGAVQACINMRAKSEWKLPTKGIRPGAHLVQLTFRPDSQPIVKPSGPPKAAPTFAPAKPGQKKSS
jgi:hypothetical protein